MKNEIYDYEERLERYRRIIAVFGHNGEVALLFLDQAIFFPRDQLNISFNLLL